MILINNTFIRIIHKQKIKCLVYKNYSLRNINTIIVISDSVRDILTIINTF